MNYRERMAAIEEYKALAEKGDAHAASMVAGLSLLGDEETSFKYANMAIELSGGAEHEALNILACCYEYGNGCEKDLKKAFDLYSKASELGNDESQYKLGTMYLIGDVVPKDLDKAERWLSRSAAAGNKAGEQYLAYVQMAKDGLVDHINMVRSEEGDEREPFLTMSTADGKTIEIKDEMEYFALLDACVRRAKSEPSAENIHCAKQIAIQGMGIYYGRYDLDNNELIYSTIKPFAVDSDCTDFELLLMEWRTEITYGTLRYAAEEKECLGNFATGTSLMERLYLVNPTENIKTQLIRQYRQTAKMFAYFDDIENAEKYMRLADEAEGKI